MESTKFKRIVMSVITAGMLNGFDSTVDSKFTAGDVPHVINLTKIDEPKPQVPEVKSEKRKLQTQTSVRNIYRYSTTKERGLLSSVKCNKEFSSSYVTSPFGRRNVWIGFSNFHSGLDLVYPSSTPVKALMGGTIIESGFGRLGLNVTVLSDDHRYKSKYGHLSKVTRKLGEHVPSGTLIGMSGCSGACLAPHLHFQLENFGKPIDPMFIKAYCSQPKIIPHK
jgi:murein DD-endopeptidase MepM/ murein hydrolase activator NlpD